MRINTILVLFLLLSGNSCTNKEKQFFFCDPQSNSVRKKYNIPVIENDMKIDNSNTLSQCFFKSHLKYPVDSTTLHVWKAINSGGKYISLEEDAFRKKIGDSIHYQLNLTTKFKKDSSVDVSGLIFKGHTNESKSLSFEFAKEYKTLSRIELDSVKRNWGLLY